MSISAFTNNMGTSSFVINGTGEQLSGNAEIDITKDYSTAYTSGGARIACVQNTTRVDGVVVNFLTHGDLA